MTLSESNMHIASINRTSCGAILLLLFVFLTPSAAQQKLVLRKVEFVGLKRLTAEQLMSVSELKNGQLIDPAALDAAADKLMKSGLFRRLSYRVHSAEDQATVTFVVEESA